MKEKKMASQTKNRPKNRAAQALNNFRPERGLRVLKHKNFFQSIEF